MQEAQVVGSFLFPADQQPACAIDPGVSALDDPASRFAVSSLGGGTVLALFGNVNDVAASSTRLSHRLGIVSFVPAKMLPFARRGLWTPHRNVFQRGVNQFLVMHICAGNGDANRHTCSVGQYRAFDPQFATVGRVFPGFFPRPVAPWSWSHRHSANSNRYDAGGRTAVAFAATLCQTRPVVSTPGSSDALCCRSHTRVATPSTDNPCEARRRCRPLPVEHSLVAGRHAATWHISVTAVRSAAKMRPPSANSIHEIPSSPASPPCCCE